MAERHPEQTRRRIAQTASRLRSLVHPEAIAPSLLEVSEATGRGGWDAAQALAYRPAEIGETFGPQWATYWFRIEATVPGAWAEARVDLVWDSGSEATLWRDAQPVQGLNSTWNVKRTEAPLTAAAEGGERVSLMVEMACNDWMGDSRRPTTPDEQTTRIGRTWREPVDDASLRAGYVHARLERVGLARFDPEAWDTYWDFEVLRALELERGLDPAWAGHLRAKLARFAGLWDAGQPEAGRALLAELLAQRNPTRTHDMTAVGHAHLDTAWLWPIAETRRKVIRSFANQLELMDRYPDHRFAASSAQHYVWLEEDAPALYERVCERVREGRWEVVGGAWVEPDCNLPSGEALVRQLLYGQRELQRRFGRRCREWWSPDTFGHGGQLPQILRGAGIDRFMTQKLSWNQFTQPAQHSFRWEGIDGSSVLAHMPPADTYNATVEVGELRAAAARFKDHDRSAHSLLVFGHGDGGGGPTAEMLELARRTADLQGVPRVQLGSSDAFFTALEEEALETVVGELYFEYHRGTYTSQAAAKRGNRHGERLLGEAEAAAALAHRLHGAPYPCEELEALWRLLLLNQFHDILPGSSIGAVYEDAARDHAAVAEGAARLRDAALAALGDGDGGWVNLTPFARTEVAGDELVSAPPYGFARAGGAGDAVTLERREDGYVLANGRLRAELDLGGRLVSLRAGGREALAGPANVLELSDDRPTAYDAWELEPYAHESRRACEGAHAHEVLAEGPLRAEVAFEHRLGEGSTLRQVVRLDAHAARLEFRTAIDWAERHRHLQVAFPLAVRAQHATYEMQFGVAARPTHTNTAADLAQFEVPGHRFADLSEHGFGVALLTDSTYGYAARGGVLRLSLLRGPTDPDPDADRGVHALAYALYPHAGGWQDGGVVAEARRFAEPLVPAPAGGPEGALAEVVSGDLVLDSIKRAEDSDALVLRLYEPHGGRGEARLRLAFPIGSVHRASLLEDEGDPLETDGGELVLAYRPFELITVLIGGGP
jgi:alpha-mannosidase